MKKDYKLRLEEIKKTIINDKSTSFYCFECAKSFTMYNSTLNGKEKIFIYPVYDIQAGKL